MSELVVGSMLLRCTNANSNKDYALEVYRDLDDPNGTVMMRCKYGPAGRLRASKEYGAFTIRDAEKHLTTKIAKGYEILNVNDKPFPSGKLLDALLVIKDGNGWESTSTSQPEQKIRAVAVTVTFDPGQFAPIW